MITIIRNGSLRGRPGAAIRFITAVGALALVTAACGGVTPSEPAVESDTTSTVAPTTSTSTSAQTSTTAAPTSTTTEPTLSLESVVGGTASGAGWLVEPGTYETAFEDQPVLIDVTEPVTYFESEGRLDFGQQVVDGNVPDWVSLTKFAGVIPVDQASQHAHHDPVVPVYTAELPEDLGAYLETVPALIVEDAGAIHGDGFTARAWNVTVDSSQGDTFSCFVGDCVGILVHEFGGVFVFGDDSSHRVWQLDEDGAGVYGYLLSRPETFEEAVALAEMLLSNLRFSE